MSVMRRLSDFIQQKLNSLLDRHEDPHEALDLAYQKQLEMLQQVRRDVADVLTAQKRLEMQRDQLQVNVTKLQGQAKEALKQNREDLARLALTRAQAAQTQITSLNAQIDTLRTQEAKLEETAQKLQTKVEAFRTQKETIKAQYSAAQAVARVGEAVTGISEHMADVNMMIDRAKERTEQMQARSAAIGQLMESGTLDQLSLTGSSDDIGAQLEAGSIDHAVNLQLESMKAEISGQLPSGVVVRISGEDQYRLAEASRAQLNKFDKKLTAAVNKGDEAGYESIRSEMLEFVRSKGAKIPAEQIVRSDVVLPGPDMELEEAKKITAAVSTEADSAA